MIPDDYPYSEALIEDLRRDVTMGCSVSALVRRIRAAHDEGEMPNRIVGRYLRMAFGIPPSGLYVLGYSRSFGNGEMADSDLNWQLLPGILERRSAWSPGDGSAGNWFDGYPTREPEAAVSDGRSDISKEGWQALSDSDRKAIGTLRRSGDRAYETIRMLSALVERMQDRIGELEGALAETGDAVLA